MDINLYYQEKGNGFPLVMLHGNGQSSEYFIHQIDYFSKKFRVITVDTRGHGKSPRGNALFTISQFAKDLNDFMDYLTIKEAIILGFSDGANIAMKFALQYPHKTKAIILNGGNLNSAGVKKSVQLPIELGYFITKLFAKKSAKAKDNMELLGLMVNEPNITVDELKTISVPALVIAGTKDLIKESHTRDIAKNIPHAKLKFMKGNHFIAHKEYQVFNEIVDSFLNDLLIFDIRNHS